MFYMITNVKLIIQRHGTLNLVLIYTSMMAR